MDTHPLETEQTSAVLNALDLDALGAFYAAWGHRSIVQGGAVWFDGGLFSMMAVPTKVVPDATDADARAILSRSGKLAAVYRVEAPRGTTVPVFMLRDKNYGPSNLQRQFRQHVDRASSSLEAHECSWEEWEIAARRCDRDTLVRHGCHRLTLDRLCSAQTRSQIAAAARAVPGLRIHACFSGGEIAAYLVHLTFGGMCEGLLAHRVDAADGSVLRHASHLLYFSFAQAAMARQEVHAVCVGRQSVPANESLARFKRHAGFEPEPCHLRIRLHPVLAPLLENSTAAALLRMIRSGLSRKIPALSNLEVMEHAGQRSDPLTAPIRQ
jgi:hypothetical protein